MRSADRYIRMVGGQYDASCGLVRQACLLFDDRIMYATAEL